MSSCFLCDCSYEFSFERDRHSVYSAPNVRDLMYMKQLPIVIGSTGTERNDQQHKHNNKQNYVSYKVKKLEFECTQASSVLDVGTPSHIPDYILIFKVPFRNPLFEYEFTFLKDFMLFSEPECVLSYKVVQDYNRENYSREKPLRPRQHKININKPFIVGPNEYLGVFYMSRVGQNIRASARVWFDPV